VLTIRRAPGQDHPAVGATSGSGRHAVGWSRGTPDLEGRTEVRGRHLSARPGRSGGPRSLPWGRPRTRWGHRRTVTASRPDRDRRPPAEETALNAPDDHPGTPGAGVPTFRLLDADGTRLVDPAHPAPEPGSPAETSFLLGALREMTLVRRMDTEATALQRQGELALWASALGQEAAQVGAAGALRAADHVFPSYREHGIAFCRGVAPLELLSLFRGVDFGGWDTERTGFGLYTLVVGAQTLHATGYAMGIQRDGLVGNGSADGSAGSGAGDAAVLAAFGDGATAQGDVNEAMIWAGVMNAPVVFFCQNNQWAISAPSDRQSAAPIYRRAEGFGFPGVRVDGNDVLATHAVVAAALARARTGQGPTLVEAFTYRMAAHTTADDATRYREAGDDAHWRERDPIARVQTYLRAGGHLDEAAAARLAAESDELARAIRSGVRAMPDPDEALLFQHAYATLPDELRQQRDEWTAYRATLGDPVGSQA